MKRNSGPIDLVKLRQQFRGAKFGELVLQHYKRNDYQTTITALAGTVDLLPNAAKAISESWIDQINPNGLNPEFWRCDCAEALTEITDAARKTLLRIGVPPSDENAFNMFQIVVLSFAYSFHKHASNRKFVRKALGQNFFRRLFG